MIPKPQKFVEAIILLILRDSDKDDGVSAAVWESWLNYMITFVMKEERLEVDGMEKGFREYVEARASGKLSYREALERAKKELGERANAGVAMS